MKASLSRSVAIAITIGVGLVVLASFFVRNTFLRALQSTFLDWAMILAAIALVLGVLNVLGTHLRKVWRRSEGWLYSIVLMAAAVAVLVLGVTGNPPGVAAPSVDWIFRNVQAPVQATLFALLAFFVLSGASRPHLAVADPGRRCAHSAHRTDPAEREPLGRVAQSQGMDPVGALHCGSARDPPGGRPRRSGNRASSAFGDRPAARSVGQDPAIRMVHHDLLPTLRRGKPTREPFL